MYVVLNAEFQCRLHNILIFTFTQQTCSVLTSISMSIPQLCLHLLFQVWRPKLFTLVAPYIATCPANHNVIDWITLIIYGEQYKSCSFLTRTDCQTYQLLYLILFLKQRRQWRARQLWPATVNVRTVYWDIYQVYVEIHKVYWEIYKPYIEIRQADNETHKVYFEICKLYI